MTSLRFDARSLGALRLYRLLRAAAFVALGVYFGLDLFEGKLELLVPDWTRFASLAAAGVLSASALIMARRVQCPHCMHQALVSIAPSWRKVRPFERRGGIKCGYCHEITGLSGGASPPSNWSPERP